MDKAKTPFAELRRKARETAPMRWSRRELAQIHLFKGAHQESIAPLLRDCPVRVLASGDVLVPAGEPCEAAFMVLSGRLRAERASPTNSDTLFLAGDSVGERMLQDKIVFSSTISAIEPTRLLVIDRDTGWALIRKSREIADNWMSLFTSKENAGTADAAGGASETPQVAGEAKDYLDLRERPWLESVLPRQLARSGTAGESVALLLVEIDGFANYVARFGKAAGERAYEKVAQLIILSIRPTDTVVAYDQGQLAVVLLDSNATNACLVGERMRKAVSRSGALPAERSALHSLTLSIGVTEFEHSGDASSLLAAAEAALNMARASGGDRIAMRQL